MRHNKVLCAHCGQPISTAVGFRSLPMGVTHTGAIYYRPLCYGGDRNCFTLVVEYGHELGLPLTDELAELWQSDSLDVEEVYERTRARTGV